MIDYVEIVIRWIFAAPMVFWGLNGFFHFVAIPPSSPTIDKFTEACLEARFIMPAVKIIEFVGGLFLLMNWGVPFVLACFAPILFVVTGLHLLYNPKPWAVLVTCSLPYLALVFIHHEALLRIAH